MYSRRITYLDAPLLKSLGIGGCRDGRHRASAKRQFDNLSRTPRGHYAISAAIGRANDVIEEGRPMSVNGQPAQPVDSCDLNPVKVRAKVAATLELRLEVSPAS